MTAVPKVYLLSPNALGDVEIDVVISESHSSELVVTEHPVESGASIVDHAYLKPKQLTLTCAVSNFSNTLTTPSLVNFIVQPSGGSDAAARVSSTYEALLDLQESRIPFNVQTGLRLYENMVITSINTLVDKDNANILRFDAQLYEVRVVTSQSVKYPEELFRDLPPKAKPEQKSREGSRSTRKKRVRNQRRQPLSDKKKAQQKVNANRGQSKANRGAVSTPQVQQSKRKSVLYRILN